MAAPDAPEKTLEGRAVISGDWKLVVMQPSKKDGSSGDTCLFNLKEDSKETQNIAGANPQKVAELLRMLNGWWDPTGGVPTSKVR
jgi:hypothetical protein